MKSRLLPAILFSLFVATGAFAQSTIGFTYYGSAVQENAGTVQFTVIRTGSLTGAASVDYETRDGNAVPNVDYVPMSGTLHFGNGESEKTVSLTLIDNNVTNGLRVLGIYLHNFVHSTGNEYYEYSVEIKDDEVTAPLALSYGNLTFSEGDGTTNAHLTVNLNRAHDALVWFTFRGYTPAEADRYNGASVSVGEVRFEPGETTKQVPLIIHGNDTFDDVVKTFHFTPINATAATVSSPDFEITLTEDDPQPTVSISDISVAEGSCGTTPIEITLTASALVNGIVQWTASDGTATQSDIDWGPYGVPEPVHMVNTTTAKLTLIAPYGDLKIEDDETFVVTLTSATNMAIGDGTAIVTIENDDVELPSFADDLVRIEAGQQSSLTINFPAPAPEGSVLLSSSDPRVVVPASVEVPERATSVTFTAGATEAAGAVIITASLPGALGATQLNATIDAFRDSDLRFQGPRRSAFAGETTLASITLDPAREEAVTVTLTASAGILVPESVIVPPGGSAEFPFTSLAAGPGWINAAYGEIVNSLVVDIAAQEVRSFAPELAPTTGGTAVTVTGVGFSSACSASFGNVPAQTTFLDGQTLIARTPAHVAENVPVTVTCGVTPVNAAQLFRFANVRRRAARH